MAEISVIIPALNAARTLPAAIGALGPGLEVIVVDGASGDGTAECAERLGARVITAARGRGTQLIAGAQAAGAPWLLFLHADTVLAPEWRGAAAAFMSLPDNRAAAAVFRFALDDPSAWARRLENIVAWRGRALCLPYGDQGLLIHREFYRSLGGFSAAPLMEDVDMIRRIGCRRLRILSAAAVTSAAKWRRDGWLARSLRNLSCLALYFAGVPPRLLVRLYG